jgi:glutamate/tyrosine decarboxylase-like PLP-dependent enzyme
VAGTEDRLYPDAAERARTHDALTRTLIDSVARVEQGPVTPRRDVAEFGDVLAPFDFAAPRHLDEVITSTIGILERGLVHVTHPRYLGLFNPSPTFPSECADRIVSVFNPQLATASTSPAAIAIERHIIAAVARRAGFEAHSGGHFTSGGSEANATALLCALTRACPGFAQNGARGFAGAPVIYVSRESHLAWIKIAHMTGIGRKAVRLVATDGAGRMDIHALQAAIARDREEGREPVMIAATAGTTGGGMIDPLEDCASIARAEGLWFHIDAAWGGALIASDRLRRQVQGIERADSFTLDAHKWFAASMGCGMFVTAHPDLLPAVFGVANAFMPSGSGSVEDPYLTSIQWSRRFLGLRLFLSLACAGWGGYGELVERAVARADQLREILVTRGWRITNESPVAVLCAEPPSRSRRTPAEIVAQVRDSGLAWISTATFEGGAVVRACITNAETTEGDIIVVADALEEAL